MKAWLACGLLVAVCARVGWVCRSNWDSVQILGLVALTAVALTVLR